MLSKLLIVDDFPETLSTMAELFSMDGREVQTASSGAEAVAVMEQKPAALILIDEDLFDISGSDLAFHLKAIANRQDPDFRCITINVRGDFSPGDEHLSAGFDFLISKPVEFKEFEALLARCDAQLAPAQGIEWGLF